MDIGSGLGREGQIRSHALIGGPKGIDAMMLRSNMTSNEQSHKAFLSNVRQDTPDADLCSLDEVAEKALDVNSGSRPS